MSDGEPVALLEAWNTRPGEDALRAERDWLRAVLENISNADRWQAEDEARRQGYTEVN